MILLNSAYKLSLLSANMSGTNNYHSLRSAGWSWSAVRDKYCYLAGGWRLELEWCERELL